MMDENMRRWLMFLLVALLLYNLFYVMPEARRRREREAAKKATPAGKTEQAERVHPEAPATGTQRGEIPSGPAQAEVALAREKGEEITIETKIFRVTFTTAGAYPIRWQIIDPAYAKATEADVDEAEALGQKGLKVGDDLPVEIIPAYDGLGPDRDYPLMVILKESGGKYFSDFNRGIYAVRKSVERDGTIVLTFASRPTKEGLVLSKTYRFPSSQYLTQLRVQLSNPRSREGQKIVFDELSRPGLGLAWGPGIGVPQVTGRFVLSNYGVAVNDRGRILGAQPNWQKARSGESPDRDFSGEIRWALLESRFYMAAIIPQGGWVSSLARATVNYQNTPADPAAHKNMSPPSTVELFTGGFSLAPGDVKTFDYAVYVGPKKRSLLAEIDRRDRLDLSAVMFHRNIWLHRVLARFMLWLLDYLHKVTGNYGVSIILLTIILCVLTQPFLLIGMKYTARAQVEMKRVKPLTDAINEKYKNDPQKRNAEIWKIYREHGVNPLGMLKGCIWMIVRVPIFIAFYVLLSSAVDLRGAHFLWIDDLTAQDALFTLPFPLPFLGNKFNLIPIAMAVSQVFAQRLQSTGMQDPTQKQMAIIFPVMLLFMFYKFPAGLSLYWFVSNIWQIGLQVFVNKRVQEEAERRAHKAFEERQAALRAAPGGAAKPKRPGFMERLGAYVEAKARQAESRRK